MMQYKTLRKHEIKALLLKYKHFVLVSLYGFAQIWFQYCERTVRPKYFMYSPLDNHIPFVKYFVVPYLFWFIYMGIGFLYLGLVSKKDFYRLCIYMFGGMYLCYVLYLLFPNGQNLRPTITENDVFSRIIKHIYATDTPTNVAPSIHVFNSIAVHVSLVNCPEFRKKRWMKLASLICMLTISASTVLIKQHSIKDVMWSIVLAVVFYVAIYQVPKWLPCKSVVSINVKEVSSLK
ncbi:phosphatidic acid phosphatase [Caldicoprobacter algeriensis]|uniref:phosphatase PAP2 family protein n=1 Tax=Caldicoprobacter algeriensis TaxID=699281 RepID=UPI00207A86D1|nr:phosphatase PAP2 family protein [Caldicoprobacter algeriensis]MCM8899632.1 phosphatidic acid phosphatase [Caldicoprobacter algeriensis]